MVSKFPGEKDEQVELHTRKGHDMTWSCDIHGEPIKFYCKEHEIPVCHPCATKDHQKPCHLDNIGDVILELVRKLDDKRLEIEKTKSHLQDLDSKIQTCSADARNHLHFIDDAANATFESKMKSVKDKKRVKIRWINEKADAAIRVINEKREKRIKSCNEDTEQQQLIITKIQANVESETKAISEVVSKKIKDLTSKNQHAINNMDNIDAKIKRIKQEDKTLVNEAPQVFASLDAILIVHQDGMDCLVRIQREVQKVKYVEGKVGGELCGRIDGYIGKWELVKSINIQSSTGPWMLGSISDEVICVRDVNDCATYVTNISTGHTQEIMEGPGMKFFTSCAQIDSNVIVCGKRGIGYTGEFLDGWITLYDRQWKVIRDIFIPRKINDSLLTDVYVDVTRDRMILTAQIKQSNIYVVNPADGKIVSTITMQGKEVNGNIQAFSSGDIVVNTDINEFTVISRSGKEKAVIHCDEGCTSWCRVDKLTDTLYITYRDKERTFSAVNQVSCDGIIQAKRIVEYKELSKYGISPCIVTPSGNLVASNGRGLIVCKKSFIV